MKGGALWEHPAPRFPSQAAVIAGVGVAVTRSRRGPTDFTGKVAFVTGGSRGLGLQLAREFAHAGCKIAICARDEDELARAAADLRSHDAEVFIRAV